MFYPLRLDGHRGTFCLVIVCKGYPVDPLGREPLYLVAESY